MTEVLVATPLKHSAVTRCYTFSDGICIREIGPILWDISIVKSFVSEHEREELAHTRYWLCATGEVAHPYGDQGNDLYEKVEHAASALQIICPSGAKNVFLKLARTERGYDNVGSHHPRELCHTLIGRITSLEEQGLAQDFDAVYASVARAFTEKIVRLQNPILLLEHAQQTGNVHLSTLMSVMGLDMLFMAGEKQPFIERLGGFLGPRTYVFPPDSLLHRQPHVVVQDVIANLYEFRNIVAHGREVPVTPFRQKYDLLDDAGNRINTQDYYYAELMLESGLFMLAAALRKIFVGGLLDEVKEESKWRMQLRLYEHRYRNTRDGELRDMASDVHLAGSAETKPPSRDRPSDTEKKMRSLTEEQVQTALSRLGKALQRYRWLQSHVRLCDVSTDLRFQTLFNRFYRVRRGSGWRSHYFALMEAAKERGIGFEDAFKKIKCLTGRMEASFASKLVATLDPSKPVIDKFVLENFDLQLPRWGLPDREPKTVELYRELCQKYDDFIGSSTGVMVRDLFDRRYPQSEIAELKKVDLVLWQVRL